MGYPPGGTAGGTTAELAPNVFKSATATAAGDTTIWTPAAGKRFRLLRFLIVLTSNSSQSVAGVITVTLRDSGVSTGMAVPVFVPGAAGALVGVVAATPGWVDLGDGYLSSAVGNVLQANLSSALATGSVGVLMSGDEE